MFGSNLAVSAAMGGTVLATCGALGYVAFMAQLADATRDWARQMRQLRAARDRQSRHDAQQRLQVAFNELIAAWIAGPEDEADREAVDQLESWPVEPSDAELRRAEGTAGPGTTTRR